MSRHDELASGFDEIVHANERSHLTRGRKSGFGFVQEVEAIGTKTIREQGHERFAVGLFVQGFSAVRADQRRATEFVQAINFGCDIEEGLRAEKETGLRAFMTTREANVAVQVGMRRPCLEAEVFRTAFGVESGRDGQRFEQRGFSAAVFADEKSDARIEQQLVQIAHRREVERVGIERRHLFPQQRCVKQEAAGVYVGRFVHGKRDGNGSLLDPRTVGAEEFVFREGVAMDAGPGEEGILFVIVRDERDTFAGRQRIEGGADEGHGMGAS